MSKYLYCKTGDHFPDEIEEVYDYAKMSRKYDEESGDYQGDDLEYGESVLFCKEHECKLEEKEGVTDVQTPESKDVKE